jgi:guanylate kinase
MSGTVGCGGRRGLMLVVSSPSGGGKTTIADMLCARDPAISRSVSVTTRAPRTGEVEGVSYYFIDRAEYDRRATAGELLEWASIHGNGYGTPRGPVEATLTAGRDMVFAIETQGKRQLETKVPADVVSVFILPPSGAVLRDRLVGRGQNSPEDLAGRLLKAREELGYWNEYDYVVINDELESCVAEVQSILDAERRKRVRWTGLETFVAGVRAEL